MLEHLWLPLATAICVVFSYFYWKSKDTRFMQLADVLPGPPALPVVGNALHFLCEPEEFMGRLTELLGKYNKVCRFWLGPDLNVIVSEPDDLKAILSSPKMSVKGPSYKYMAQYIGGGILSGSGTTWRRHRKLASPNYGKRAIQSYTAVFNQEVELLLQNLRLKPPKKDFDIYRDIVFTTSYSVCQTLLALSKDQTMNLPYLKELIENTHGFYEDVFKRMVKWWHQVELFYLFTRSHSNYKRFVAMIKEFGEAVLEHRTKALNAMKANSKIDLMTSEEDSKRNTELGVMDRFILSNELSYEELITENMTIFTSSQEASAKIASSLLLMMAYHPQCQEKLYSEIVEVMGTTERAVTDDDLKKMNYLEMVFKECVRLFPIGAIIQRTVTEEFQMSTYTLPAGCSLVASIYHLQRDQRYWTKPNDFDPERFSPENMKKRNPNAYIPFSLGPMDCLGRYFGTKLIKTICVRVMREFKLSSSETYDDLKLLISVSVISKNGYKVSLQRRT